MARKDYIKFAFMLNRIRGGLDTGYDSPHFANGQADAFAQVTRDMCDVFRKDNPRFDRNRFMDVVYGPIL